MGPPPALMQAMGEFVQRSFKNGSLVETGGLLPSKDGVLIRLEKGELIVKDGPFTETKEVIGGYAIIEARDKSGKPCASARSFFMELHRKYWPEFEGESEVRPMFDPGMGP